MTSYQLYCGDGCRWLPVSFDHRAAAEQHRAQHTTDTGHHDVELREVHEQTTVPGGWAALCEDCGGASIGPAVERYEDAVDQWTAHEDATGHQVPRFVPL